MHRARREPRTEADSGAICCLLGHLRRGSVSTAEALAVANDATLAAEVRLAARFHADSPLDNGAKELISGALSRPGYFPYHSAALAMSSTTVDMPSVLELLQAPSADRDNASRALSDLFDQWPVSAREGRLLEVLASNDIQDWMRILALQHLVTIGRVAAFDDLLSKMPSMSIETISETIILIGHVLDRSRVQRTVSMLSVREWAADERSRLGHSLMVGLKWRVHKPGVTSTIEPLARHPGLTASFPLLESWILRTDYEPWKHLSLVVEAVQIGVPGAITLLRSAFERAMATPTSQRLNDEASAGHALEALHARGMGVSIDELERIAATATYNLCNSALRLLAKIGTLSAAESLMRLFIGLPADLRKSLLEALEPLAGRLGLRITRVGDMLLASAV